MIADPPVAPHAFRLDNGLSVVIVPGGASPAATLMVVYRVGARNEAVGYTGSSHLLEHMLFKGTHANSRATGRAFADMMNEIGASKNATTWIDRTNYFETVPLEFLPFAIELEADRMRNALIADADRRSEMTVVRNELERNDNNPVRVLNAALVGTAFREHPYHHPTIGWRSDVEGVSTDRLRELYDTYYHPSNATVFVVGDVDVARTRDLVERSFGTIASAAAPVPDVYTDEPPQVGERSVVVKRPGDDTFVGYAFHTPSAFGRMTVDSTAALAARALGGESMGDGYALDLLGRVLAGGRASRLSRSLVDASLALDVSAWNWGSRDPGLFQILASVRPGVAPGEVRAAIDAALADVAANGPTADELERARTQLEVSRAFGRDGTSGIAHRLAEFEAVGTWRFDDDLVERLRAVTPDDVRAAAERYLHEDNRTVGTLVPGTPRTLDVVAVAPVERRAQAAAETVAAPLPAVPAIVAGRSFASRIARVGEGADYAARYVEHLESATVHVRGLVEIDRTPLEGRPMLGSIASEMLSRGTRTHGRHAIEERLERSGARRGYDLDDDPSGGYDLHAFRFSGACTVGDLALLLETLTDELREPAFLEAELEQVKTELVGALRLARTSTSFRATQRFMQLLYRADGPNAGVEVDDAIADVERTTVADVRAFHERGILAGRASVSAAGGIGTDAFARALGATIGTLPFAGRPDTVVDPGALAPRAVRADVPIARKANVDVTLGRASSLVRSSPDYVAAQIANGILGQSTLSSRLGLQLRDREGLTYGVTSSFLAGGRMPGPWRIVVGVNPANVDRAIVSVCAVLRDYAEHGPTERELVQQRNSMAGQLRVALATNGGIASQLERMAYHDLPEDHVDTYRARLEATDRAAVHAAAATYLGPDELAIAVAGTAPADAVSA